jgi:hypothetical protein
MASAARIYAISCKCNLQNGKVEQQRMCSITIFSRFNYFPLKNGNIAANLPNVCHLYGRTIAGYYENVHERQTWKMEQNKKKTSGIPFTVDKLRETADVIKR